METAFAQKDQCSAIFGATVHARTSCRDIDFSEAYYGSHSNDPNDKWMGRDLWPNQEDLQSMLGTGLTCGKQFEEAV